MNASDAVHRRQAPAWMTAALWSTIGVLASQVGAQPPSRPERAMAALNIRCDSCHTCETPTPEQKCLRSCVRGEMQRIATEFKAKRGPRLVILDELESRYLPVPFDHEGHAGMADMAGGCAACHHYTPEGLEHPACKTCHSIEASEAEIHMPGLKGAYHRQCMGCHREWSGETRCGVCHHPKAGAARLGEAQVIPSKDDLIGRMHPPIPEPDVEVYLTKGEGYTPSKVMFRHKHHIHGYDLKCADCHREDNCNRCHEGGRKHVQRERTLQDHHKPCLECHRNSSCERCHFAIDEQPPTTFTHASIGWPFTRYHENLSCRACHATVPYGKQSTACNSCHEAWSPENFDHAVTGLALDDAHRLFDCVDCHLERRFDQAPACSGCHGEDEGITYPAKRPGELVSRPESPNR